jgi:hypothetical protein
MAAFGVNMRDSFLALFGHVLATTNCQPVQSMGGKILETFLGQILALMTFFAFPVLKYFALKRFSANEGAPELWYLPRYGFRLVIRNLPGKYVLSDLKQKAFLRSVIRSGQGASVATLQDEVVVERTDFFLFPGIDQILICFQLQGDTADNLSFVVTDKLGHEKSRLPLEDFQKLVCDYSATLNNPFNFNVKLAKRTELDKESLIQFWQNLREENVERSFSLSKIRDVG